MPKKKIAKSRAKFLKAFADEFESYGHDVSNTRKSIQKLEKKANRDYYRGRPK